MNHSFQNEAASTGFAGRAGGRSFIPLAFGALLLIVAVLTLSHIFTNVDWSGTGDRAIDKELEKLINCETYQLVARKSGWYLCYLCEKQKIYLEAGMVWKYGYTCNPAKRYSYRWLKRMNLDYMMLLEGNMMACRALEIMLIGKYKFHPENLKRLQSEQLIVPPGSKTTSLR